MLTLLTAPSSYHSFMKRIHSLAQILIFIDQNDIHPRSYLSCHVILLKAWAPKNKQGSDFHDFDHWADKIAVVGGKVPMVPWLPGFLLISSMLYLLCDHWERAANIIWRSWTKSKDWRPILFLTLWQFKQSWAHDYSCIKCLRLVHYNYPKSLQEGKNTEDALKCIFASISACVSLYLLWSQWSRPLLPVTLMDSRPRSHNLGLRQG